MPKKTVQEDARGIYIVIEGHKARPDLGPLPEQMEGPSRFTVGDQVKAAAISGSMRVRVTDPGGNLRSRYRTPEMEMWMRRERLYRLSHDPE